MSGQSTLAAAVASLSFRTKTNLSSNTITESGQQRKVAELGITFTRYGLTILLEMMKYSSEEVLMVEVTFGSTINLSNNGGESFNPHMAVS